MGSFFGSLFKKKEAPRARINGFVPRIKNIAVNNWRGLIGVLVPLCALSWQAEKGNHTKTLELMWMWMLWFYIFQPVNIPVTGMIPVFLLPMCGIVSSFDTCKHYMNENVVLFLITGMLILLLNNSGIDRRIALWFICSGDSCQFSGKRLVLKVSIASFFLSMFSSRLITSFTIIQYITNAMTQLQSATPKGTADTDFQEMRYIINNAVQTASGIGSTAIFHSSYATVLFRAVFVESAPNKMEYPDIFNYLQYSAFAFPVACVMFMLNVGYHMVLINWSIKPMTAASMVELRKILLKSKAEIPRRLSLHEHMSLFFKILMILMFFFRWNKWTSGWADYQADTFSPQIPKIKDATIAAVFLITLHVLPKSYGFMQYLSAERRSQLPPPKPESGILWWRFVDKNINYGYFFTFGSALAIMAATKKHKLDVIIAENFGREFTKHPWNGSIFLVCFIASILANLTTALAACGIFLPFVMAMSKDAEIPWPSKSYCGALGAGIASSFGFCLPFMYTPAYYCHYTGKTPILKMVKYSFMSVWICLLTLWIALLIWAPFLFDPEDAGIVPVDAPTTTPYPTSGKPTT